MTKIFCKVLWFICILMVMASSGCQIDSNSSSTNQTEKGSWAIYTPFDWTHDGKPCQSIYCSIFSDAASDKMKKQVGEIADESFNKILQLFNFHNISDFIYPPGYSKIDIYINRNHSENINWAYWGGFIFTIRSSDICGHWLDYTEYTASHELMHEFEFLIEGREVLSTDVWFKEGIAVHVGYLRNTVFKIIKNLNELETWISKNQNVPGQGNPIKIRQNSDFPDGADIHQYYRFFELAMRYLIDEDGYGQSFQDVLKLIYDLRQGLLFPVSFENHFGISVIDFENEFFDRMRAYLDSGSFNKIKVVNVKEAEIKKYFQKFEYWRKQ